MTCKDGKHCPTTGVSGVITTILKTVFTFGLNLLIRYIKRKVSEHENLFHNGKTSEGGDTK